MATRNTQWYPYEQLGPMYVHTNYHSFKSNVGSFGDHGSLLDAQFQMAIQRQIEREDTIDQLMRKIFDRGLDDFIVFVQDWWKMYNKTAHEAWISPEIQGREKYGGILTALYETNIQDGVKKIEDVLSSIVDVMDTMWQEGFINLERFEELEVQINERINDLRTMIGDYQGSAEESGMYGAIRGAVFGIKGLVWDYFIAAVAAAFLRQLDKSEMFTLISTGRMRGAKGDIAIPLENKALSINIKSTSTKTFQEHGAYIHYGSIGSILRIIESYSLAAGEPVRDAKYYLINVSRMLAHPLTAQGGARGGIPAFPQGQKLIADLMKTYTAVFIGDTLFPDSGDISEAVKQADVFIIQDNAYRKSTLLQGLYSGEDFSAALKIDYQHASGDYWENFDALKRSVLRSNRGNYADSGLLRFVRPEAEKLLKQKASVKLRLLMK